MLATSGPETQVYTQAQPLGEKLMSEARLCDTSGSNIAQRFGVAEALSCMDVSQSYPSNRWNVARALERTSSKVRHW